MKYAYVYFSEEKDLVLLYLNRVRKSSDMEIKSLEGVFVSDEELVLADHIMEIPREKMSKFEKEYFGKFVPFR